MITIQLAIRTLTMKQPTYMLRVILVFITKATALRLLLQLPNTHHHHLHNQQQQPLQHQ
jgi:hypothetical protein